jgi:hypothetical protein
MCQHLVLSVAHATCFDPCLSHLQAHDEYKLSLIELRLNSNMDPYYILTRFLHRLFAINTEAIYILYPIYDTQQDAYYEDFNCFTKYIV